MAFIAEKKSQQQGNDELNRLHQDGQLFNFLLSRQPHYPVERNASSIILGNVSANNLVTIVTNPFCVHCAEIHEVMQRYDFLHTPDYCIQFVFDSYSSDKQIIDELLVSLFLSIEEDAWIAILNDWFRNGRHNPGKFMERYTCVQISAAECRKHWDWVNENKIIKTPLVLLNGRKLPDNYTIKDLIFLE